MREAEPKTTVMTCPQLLKAPPEDILKHFTVYSTPHDEQEE